MAEPAHGVISDALVQALGDPDDLARAIIDRLDEAGYAIVKQDDWDLVPKDAKPKCTASYKEAFEDELTCILDRWHHHDHLHEGVEGRRYWDRNLR